MKIKTIKEKIQAYYLNKKNWELKPPSIRKVVKETGYSLATVFKYIKEIK